MRIQHNIMAMNSYRNFSSNTKSLSKNLEKLSSGYRINRAGDDAAGLAISEKMRAQITGLKTAQKNAKDGISLVQTAEGSLTEVHSMLNRMLDLADQSANGTYDNDVDRANLQKEATQLKSEIDRIADSTNFNGIKLLDGSLSGKGTTSGTIAGGWDSIKGALAAGVTDVDAVKAKSTFTIGKFTGSVAGANGDTYSLTLGMSDGTEKVFTVTASVDSKFITRYKDQDGNVVATIAAKTASVTVANRKIDDITTALQKAIKDSEFGKQYNVTGTVANGQIVLEAKTAGANTAHVASMGFAGKTKSGTNVMSVVANDGAGLSNLANTQVKGADKYQGLDLDKAVTFTGSNLDKAVFEINGEKFVFVASGKVNDDTIAAMKEAGITHYVETAAATVAPANDVAAMVEKIKFATGLEVGQGTVAVGVWTDSAAGGIIKLGNGVSTKANGGLTLQIGDTTDSYNKLTVAVEDMHAKALGIDQLNIGTQEGADEAVDMIKAAINSVSGTRGTLGSLQNRLDHTINNLSVMHENIQDAEATIRDVDVAEEMMDYTKNNILVQSAQAMLAQANQVPQGVLQLLQ